MRLEAELSREKFKGPTQLRLEVVLMQNALHAAMEGEKVAVVGEIMLHMKLNVICAKRKGGLVEGVFMWASRHETSTQGDWSTVRSTKGALRDHS